VDTKRNLEYIAFSIPSKEEEFEIGKKNCRFDGLLKLEDVEMNDDDVVEDTDDGKSENTDNTGSTKAKKDSPSSNPTVQ
jgi:hypothetical protein